MIEFFSNSRALFIQIAQMGSHFAQNTTTNPCSLLSRHKTLSGTPNHPFSWPEPERGQNELPSVQNALQLGKMFESGQDFSRSGRNKFIHISGVFSYEGVTTIYYVLLRINTYPPRQI